MHTAPVNKESFMTLKPSYLSFSAAKRLALFSPLLCLLLLTACAPQQSGLQHHQYSNVRFTPIPDEEFDDGDIEVTPELLKEPSLYPALSLIQPIKETIRVTSSFGLRKHPVKRRRLMHAGVDIAGNRGEKVVASAPGKVVYSGRKGSYGLTIDIDAGKGVTLRYAHLDKLGVRKGQKVKQGQYIGNLGRTGRVTGPHLHFEVRLRDKPINPMQFLTHEHQWASNTGTKQRKRSGNL